MSWRVERRSLSAAAFHALDLPDPVERTVWVADPTSAALVLGSTQPDADVRPEIDIEVVRRRSGGGAVLVVPGDVLWVDVIVPAGDGLWDDDVARASHWLGEAWAAALGALGVHGEVHRGSLVRTPWSAAVCFAGVGPGEVSIDGRKAIGISQRRTRAAARFQCAALASWNPATLLSLLTVEAEPDDLEPLATGTGVPLDDLLTAFLLHLP